MACAKSVLLCRLRRLLRQNLIVMYTKRAKMIHEKFVMYTKRAKMIHEKFVMYTKRAKMIHEKGHGITLWQWKSNM